MANKKGHRQFGYVRKLSSGRYQASYLAPDGLRRYAPNSFGSRKEASDWLTLKQAELLRGEWTDPVRGKVKLHTYAARWIDERELGERTRGKYKTLLRLHVKPFLGANELGDISTETVRVWLHRLRNEGRGETTIANAYRFLRAVLNTAVDDERIRRNPCRIKSAGREKAKERPVASIPQVFALAEVVPDRFRALILAAAFTGLRWGELAGLRRADLDFGKRVIHVRRTLMQLDTGHLQEGPPKSAAGARTVSMPPMLVDELTTHLAEHTRPGPRARVFTGGDGGDLRRDNWHRDADWTASLKAAGLPKGFHFHDLRHTGNHLASQSGANLRELMRRMGHGSVRAAMIYQHATDERDREIADLLGGLVDKHRADAAVSGDHDDDEAVDEDG